jgi:hypothetical protein
VGSTPTFGTRKALFHQPKIVKELTEEKELADLDQLKIEKDY